MVFVLKNMRCRYLTKKIGETQLLLYFGVVE